MIISQTPLRISFVGGGSDLKSFYDYSPGIVVSSTIDKYVFVIVKERFDEDIYVSWSKKNEIVQSVNDIEHDLVRESLKKVGITKSLEISMLADIPSNGSGLGSSSSLTVGLLNALYNYKGIQVSAEKLAREACEIEIDVLKNPIGKQDQYIAAYGGLNKFTFLRDNIVEIDPIKLSSENRLLLGSNLLLYFTGITRNANNILKEQDQNTKKKINELIKMTDYASILYNDLKSIKFKKLGILLKKNWELKKTLSKNITKPEIDKMINIADLNGAFGYKICGAGGGGFLLNFVNRDEQNKFRKSMKKYIELPFMLEPFGSRIIFNMRRYNSNT